MLKRLDQDNSGEISREELLLVLEDEEALSVLRELEVDVGYFFQLMEMHFDQDHDDNIHIDFIMHLILACRGDHSVTVKHIVDAQIFARWDVKTRIDRQEQQFAGELTKWC